MILGGMVFVTLGYEFVSSSSCIAHSSFHIPPENICDLSWVSIFRAACREASDRFSIVSPE